MDSGHSWGSTRFWLTAATTVASLWGQIKGFIPEPYGSYITIGGLGIYTLAETAYKIVKSIQAVKAGQAAVTPVQ